MLTDRCNFRLSKFLKDHGFPQRSIEFDSDYYDCSGVLHYNLGPEVEKEDLIFAPYIAEVIDRLEIDHDLYLSVCYDESNGYQYRIYDLNSKSEIISKLFGIEDSNKAYELCILRAYDDQEEGEGITREAGE